MAYKALCVQVPDCPFSQLLSTRRLPPLLLFNKRRPLSLLFPLLLPRSSWLAASLFLSGANQMSSPQRGYYSPPFISPASGIWGPREGLGFSKREITIGPFVVTKWEHNICLLNKFIDNFTLNLGTKWKNIKI